MGIEHFEGMEIPEAPSTPENGWHDIESERPNGNELPLLENGAQDAGDRVEWKAEDAGREMTELPHVQTIESGMDVKDIAPAESTENSANETDNQSQSDVENNYYSTYEERIKQTPAEESDRGEWSGERGESDYTPTDEEVKDILDKYDKDSITYEDAIPDFSEVSEATVEIDNMSEDRAENFRQCDEKCAEQWNKEGRDGRTDWTARDVKEWRQANGYSWHERNDMKTCDLVPTQVNAYFGHLGGVSECKKRDAGNGGSDFDE